MSRCRSCGAEITWAKTEQGKRIPLDTEPADNGNLMLADGIARPPGLDDEVQPHLYISHFATCGQADEWRRK